jgi:hypothetical protein
MGIRPSKTAEYFVALPGIHSGRRDRGFRVGRTAAHESDKITLILLISGRHCLDSGGWCVRHSFRAPREAEPRGGRRIHGHSDRRGRLIDLNAGTRASRCGCLRCNRYSGCDLHRRTDGTTETPGTPRLYGSNRRTLQAKPHHAEIYNRRIHPKGSCERRDRGVVGASSRRLHSCPAAHRDWGACWRRRNVRPPAGRAAGRRRPSGHERRSAARRPWAGYRPSSLLRGLMDR